MQEWSDSLKGTTATPRSLFVYPCGIPVTWALRPSMGCSFGGLGIRGRYPVIPSQNEGGFLLIHSRSKMSTPVLLHHCLRPPILALLSFLFFHPEKVQWVYVFFFNANIYRNIFALPASFFLRSVFQLSTARSTKANPGMPGSQVRGWSKRCNFYSGNENLGAILWTSLDILSFMGLET